MNLQVVDRIVQKYEPQINRELAITRSEYADRWRKVQTAMRLKGYDLAYACGSELDRSDVAWLAAIFDPIIERYGILIPADGKPVVLAGSEGGHVLEESVRISGADIALLREYQISDEDYRFAKFEGLEDIVRRVIPPRPGEQNKVALFSSGQFIPHDHLALFSERFGSESVKFDAELLQRIKYEKSPAELAVIGMANKIADAAFLGMLSAVTPGVRELDVAAVGDYIMKKLGAGRAGFPTIVSSGTRGRTVLGPATNRILRKGEFVSIGISPTFNGYHGIMRRTVKVGDEWNKEEKAFMDALEGLYHTVMNATVEAAQKDTASNTIDQRGKEYIERTKVKDRHGRMISPREPYTFIHNTGCSECQEGFGAVTPYTAEPLGESVALMIDVAFMGFDEKKELVFPIEYAVIEDGFWKRGKTVGVYNRMPLNVQPFVAKHSDDVPANMVNPYHKVLSTDD